MRAVVQRVTQASVTVGDELISSIGRGLCILIGICRDDTPKEREYIARKILNLRVFDDDNHKRWNKSVKDKNFEILCVSQFTLYSVLKGNKPDFHNAMPGDQSKLFYEEFLELLRKGYKPDKIKDGKFAAYMQVSIQNDGPVTISLEATPEVTFYMPEASRGATPGRAASGSKTPVAVVRAQPQDRTIERASGYVSTFMLSFSGQIDKQETFLKLLEDFRDNKIEHIPQLILEALDLMAGHKELLCGFSGFLPHGYSISILNDDPRQVRVDFPQGDIMTKDDLKKHVGEIKKNNQVGGASAESPKKSTRSMDELIQQLQKLML